LKKVKTQKIAFLLVPFYLAKFIINSNCECRNNQNYRLQSHNRTYPAKLASKSLNEHILSFVEKRSLSHPEAKKGIDITVKLSFLRRYRY
jgi:hypothetical protein